MNAEFVCSCSIPMIYCVTVGLELEFWFVSMSPNRYHYGGPHSTQYIPVLKSDGGSIGVLCSLYG